MKYKATFLGKVKGAIGVRQKFINVPVEGETKHDALINLYETHEHIHLLKMEEDDESERD